MLLDTPARSTAELDLQWPRQNANHIARTQNGRRLPGGRSLKVGCGGSPHAVPAALLDSVRVTTPLRTLVDVIVDGALASEVLVQAVDQAIRRGLVRRKQFDAAEVSTRARQRVNRILKQVPDDRPTPVRNSRRPAGRTGSATPRPRTS